MTCALIFTIFGYILFIVFIQMEGCFAFRTQTELALAHGIQQTLAPIIDVAVAGCEIYGISVPIEKVGGDLVDVVALPDGSAVSYVADIAAAGDLAALESAADWDIHDQVTDIEQNGHPTKTPTKSARFAVHSPH